ncbi:MAG: hypothetical protein KAS32_27580, partial [Candidatus Peribacteraceae bacterium]|nr:hypothetical protein [Candidatus Peribacteraceae bacterium]
EVVDKETKLVGFYKDIVSDIQIDQLDSKGNTVYSVVLEEAYPLIVTDMGLVAGETDTIHRINVSFTYRKWRYTGDNSDTKKSYSSFTPFRAIEALQDGNISEAIMSSVKLYNSVKSGNFAGEALAVFDMVDGFLGDNVGISASDADKVLRNIQGDVQLNDRLSIEDKLNLDDVINDIIIRIQ